MSTAKDQLRHRLAERQRENAELVRTVRGLQARYEREVAPVEEAVLKHQVERLRRAAQAHMRSARLRNAYHDAQQAYEEVRQVAAPSPTAHGALKQTYREASKRCHPDAVPDAYRDSAAATFQSLDAAYQAGHGAAVEAIADALDTWGFPDPPETREETSTAARLRDAVSGLEASIQALRSTDAFQQVQEAGSLDAAIEAHKCTLARRLDELDMASRPRTHR